MNIARRARYLDSWQTYRAAGVNRLSIGVQSFAWALANNAWQARVETILPAVAGAARDGLRPIDAELVQDFYDRVVPGIDAAFDAPAMLHSLVNKIEATGFKLASDEVELKGLCGDCARRP